jgi:glycosyltransferase involved in cell wall biosynthesis
MLQGETKYHVLYISSWFPTKLTPTNGDFVERHAIAVAEYCNVSILHVCFDPTLSVSFILDNKKSGNANSYIYYLKSPNYSLAFLNKLIRLIKYIWFYIKGLNQIESRHGKVNLVHANVLFPIGLIALYYKFIRGISYVLTEHWTGYLPEDGTHISKFRIFLSKRICKNALKVLPVSENLAYNMKLKGLTGNYCVVPNVVDISAFKIVEGALKPLKKHILHISTLVDEQKNITGILNVMNQLSEIRNDFELHILGGNNEYAMNYSEKLGLINSVVYFHGEVANQEIFKYLNLSSFLLLFSNYENFPCVIVESLACGVPVLSTNVGGIAEHVTTNFGILIPRRDELALFSAVQKMLDTVNTYKPHDLRYYAIKNFSYQAVGEKYYEIYKSLLSN